MFNRLFNPFARPSLTSVMVAELDQARHALLEAETARDFAQSVADYNIARINRLTQGLSDHGAES